MTGSHVASHSYPPCAAGLGSGRRSLSRHKNVSSAGARRRNLQCHLAVVDHEVVVDLFQIVNSSRNAKPRVATADHERGRLNVFGQQSR